MGYLFFVDYLDCGKSSGVDLFYLNMVNGYCGYQYMNVIDLFLMLSVVLGMLQFIKVLGGDNILKVQYFVMQLKVQIWGGVYLYDVNMNLIFNVVYFLIVVCLMLNIGFFKMLVDVVFDLGNDIDVLWIDLGNNCYQGDWVME